jgi:hypothetical protein
VQQLAWIACLRVLKGANFRLILLICFTASFFLNVFIILKISYKKDKRILPIKKALRKSEALLII